MKLLMVTSRNIDKKGGENALIIGRQASLYKKYRVETDIIFFHKDTELCEKKLCLGINFIQCRRENLYQKLEMLIDRGEYKGIIVSGFYDKKFTLFIRKKKKQDKFLYIVDVHATVKEIYEYCSPDLYHVLGTRYLYIRKKINFIRTLKLSDYAFVVSDEEIVEINNFLPSNKIKFIKVRCGCYTKLEKKNYFDVRIAQREKLNISEETLAFVYSGSRDRWQKYDETVLIYKKIQETGIKCKFAFYMNMDDQEKSNLYSILGAENVIVRWIAPEDMKKELTAYDVGMLLRDYKWTNRVAFPNKFSDYLAGGLSLALSSAVVEPYKIVKKYNLELFDISNIELSIKAIGELRKYKLNDYIEICSDIVSNELLYDKQVEDTCKELVDKMESF